MRFLLLAITLLISATCFATPKEIIIIRHGDKLPQKSPGVTLSAKGQLRAEALVPYFLKTFGRPDFIFVSKPSAKHSKSHSFREIQTVAPLANRLTQLEHKAFPINYPYRAPNYANLADLLLSNVKYDNKLILVCWDHRVIPKLAKLLGVNQKLTAWPKEDFDSVYIIKYTLSGKVRSFKILNHQYSVPNINWKRERKETE